MLFFLLVIIIIISVVLCHSICFLPDILNSLSRCPVLIQELLILFFHTPVQSSYRAAVGSISHPRPLSLGLWRLQ